MHQFETANFVQRHSCINCGGKDLAEISSGRFDQDPVQRFIDEDPWGENPAPFLKGHTWSFVRCNGCGQRFHRNILDTVWNERRFERWMSQGAIKAFAESVTRPNREFAKAVDCTDHVLRIERLTRSIRGSNATRILDFGCGYGDFIAMCSMYGFDAYGVDRSRARRENNAFARVFPDIDGISDMAPFHALTLFEVLEHLDDPRGLMLRLRDLLVTGGILVLETPDCSGVRDIQTIGDYRKIHPLDHINAFTPETLIGFAARLGFSVMRKPVTCVTSNKSKMAKRIVRGLLSPIMKQTTQMYFRKN